MSPAENMHGYLVSKGLVDGSSAWAGRIGGFDDGQDQMLVFMDGGGLAPNPKWLYDRPNVQIMVRAAKYGYSSAYARAQRIKDTILGMPPTDFASDGSHWSGVTMLTDIVPMGNDENGRPMFSLNFRILLEPAPSADSNRASL